MKSSGIAGILALAVVFGAGDVEAAGRTCRLDLSVTSVTIAGLEVDQAWSLTEVRDHPLNPRHEYVGRLVDGAGRVRNVPDGPQGPSIKGQGLVWTSKDKWDCRPEAVRRKEIAAKAAARAPLVSESYRQLLSCRGNLGALIGLSRDALRARCGIWARATLTVTAGGSRELIAYGHGFEGGPFLLVELDGGQVTAVQKR